MRLREHAPDRLGEIPCLVVAGDDDGDERLFPLASRGLEHRGIGQGADEVRLNSGDQVRRTRAARVRTLPGRVCKAVVQSRLQSGVGRFLHGEGGRPLQQLSLAPHFCAAGFRVDGNDGNTILEREHHAVQPRCHHDVHARQQRLDSGGSSESSAVLVQPRVDCDPNHVPGSHETINCSVSLLHGSGIVRPRRDRFRRSARGSSAQPGRCPDGPRDCCHAR